MSYRQFFSFYLGQNLYGIDIMMVREIINDPQITPVDGARDIVRGLLNLRGQIVTALDPATPLGLEETNLLTEDAYCIILKTTDELVSIGATDEGEIKTSDDIAGFLVDRVGEVYDVDEHEIEQAPSNLNGDERKLYAGVVKLDDDLMMILNVPLILS